LLAAKNSLDDRTCGAGLGNIDETRSGSLSAITETVIGILENINMNKAQLISSWHELPWNEIKLKANKYLPKIIFILLIILITQLFAEMTWRAFAPAQESVSNQVKNNITGIIPVEQNTSLKEVSAYHLFGDARKQAVVQQKVIDAPDTRLRLDLKGVFATTIASDALAIISSSKDKDKTYHIGDKVVGMRSMLTGLFLNEMAS